MKEQQMNLMVQMKKMCPVIYRMARSDEMGSELYQDIWLKCLEKRRIDWSQPHLGLIVSIARGLRADRYRKGNRHKSCLAELAVIKSCPEGCKGNRPSVEWNLVESCVRQLSPKLRVVVEQGLAGKTDKELASEMRTTPTTIRQWRSRGIKELRKMLSEIPFD